MGPFELTDADPERIVSLADSLAFLPERPLTPDEAAAVRHGRSIAGNAVGPVRLMLDGELVAVAREQEGLLRPETVLA